MDVTRRFEEPDELIEFGGVTDQLISIGGLTVSRAVQPPGWRWSTDFKPLVGGERCRARHVGLQLSGRQAIEREDGTTYEIGPGELYDIAPGHDGWTLGDEPSVALEWAGMRTWIGGARNRILASLVFTDIVDSTGTAARLGDAAWHELLEMHYHASDDVIARFGGRRVTTTGDGVLAVFEAAVNAVRAADAMLAAAAEQDLLIRVGVHVGEVELAGDDVRGVTVHEASRVMATAGPNEVLVSEAVAMLCRSSPLTFEEAGEHELKGVEGRWRLYRVASEEGVA
jgi:class 3 adenylate cyclase